MGQGSAKVLHPGMTNILSNNNNSGSVSNNTAGSYFIPYEKLAKAVEAMTK